MEEGLRFRGSGEGSFRGEGDLVPTRYEWGRAGRGGGNWKGSGTMSYGRIYLKCVCVCGGGGGTVLPLPLDFLAWVCVVRVGGSRVTLLLPNSGREPFQARRACFEI